MLPLLGVLGGSNQTEFLRVPERKRHRALRLPAAAAQRAQSSGKLEQRRRSRAWIDAAERPRIVMRAEQEGIVSYSNDRYWDASSQVREGASVCSRQKIFSLPDA
jgi:hypothetical protein